MAIFMERVGAFFIALITVITGFFGVQTNPFAQKVDEFKVTTYIRGDYVQDENALYPEDFDIVTDVILFECTTFNNKGEIEYDQTKLETALANIRNAIGDRDVNITINLLGPGGNTDSTVWEDQMEAQSNEHNKAFTSGVLEDNIVALLDKYNFDGVHFDYEYPLSNKAWDYYNDFIVSLDKKLGDYTLGVAGNSWNIHFTTQAINAIDTFELMSYDMIDDEGKHATYKDTINLARQCGLHGVPFEKINIGLAFYSRPTDMDAYWYGYNGCYENIDENGWYHCEETGKDFWFNLPQDIQDKTEFAINNGFGGVMIWHYSCDLPSSHPDSLLKGVATAVDNNY